MNNRDHLVVDLMTHQVREQLVTSVPREEVTLFTLSSLTHIHIQFTTITMVMIASGGEGERDSVSVGRAGPAAQGFTSQFCHTL